MSSSAFCIDAAASTVMCLPCGNGGDVTMIAHSAAPAIAANRSVISSPPRGRSNCIRSPLDHTQLYPIREGQSGATCFRVRRAKVCRRRFHYGVYRLSLVGELADQVIVEPLAAPVGGIARTVAAQKSVATIVVADHLNRGPAEADHRGPDHHLGVSLRLFKRAPPGSPHPEFRKWSRM